MEDLGFKAGRQAPDPEGANLEEAGLNPPGGRTARETSHPGKPGGREAGGSLRRRILCRNTWRFGTVVAWNSSPLPCAHVDQPSPTVCSSTMSDYSCHHPRTAQPVICPSGKDGKEFTALGRLAYNLPSMERAQAFLKTSAGGIPLGERAEVSMPDGHSTFRHLRLVAAVPARDGPRQMDGLLLLQGESR